MVETKLALRVIEPNSDFDNIMIGNSKFSDDLRDLRPFMTAKITKESGVTRSTLYNNAQLKECILSLRAISKVSPLNNVIAIPKDKVQLSGDYLYFTNRKW